MTLGMVDRAYIDTTLDLVDPCLSTLQILESRTSVLIFVEIIWKPLQRLIHSAADPKTQW